MRWDEMRWDEMKWDEIDEMSLQGSTGRWVPPRKKSKMSESLERVMKSVKLYLRQHLRQCCALAMKSTSKNLTEIRTHALLYVFISVLIISNYIQGFHMLSEVFKVLVCFCMFSRFWNVFNVFECFFVVFESFPMFLKVFGCF